jgi:hypothetical protein
MKKESEILLKINFLLENFLLYLQQINKFYDKRRSIETNFCDDIIGNFDKKHFVQGDSLAKEELFYLP